MKKQTWQKKMKCIKIQPDPDNHTWGHDVCRVSNRWTNYTSARTDLARAWLLTTFRRLRKPVSRPRREIQLLPTHYLRAIPRASMHECSQGREKDSVYTNVILARRGGSNAWAKRRDAQRGWKKRTEKGLKRARRLHLASIYPRGLPDMHRLVWLRLNSGRDAISHFSSISLGQ